MIATGVSLPPPTQARVLVVDDEKFIRDILADFLTMEGFFVHTAEDGQQAVNELSRRTYDLVLSDLKMPRMGGLDLLEHISRHHPDTLTVIMTGFGTVETAIDAMKHGAYDYILKPFKVEEIVHVVTRGIEKQRLSTENLRLREALSLYKVSEAITQSLSLDDVVAHVADNATEELGADAISMWLADGNGGFFERMHKTKNEELHDEAGEQNSETLAARLRSGAPLIVNGNSAFEFFKVAPARGIKSFASVPLTMQGRFLGWISVSSWTEGQHFTEGQRKLLTIIASRTAAAIENARLYEDLQATFQQTIQSLANTIDKMDRYTAGHSERVAVYASRLAHWLGLGEADVEVVRQAALMHDIGKIGCVMNLNKPGKLTASEYEVFQKHPTYGKEILDPIQFLQPVIPGVFLHHERWDGRGYPLRMEGNTIPLIARIISVADTYDAMTSDRAYRKSMPHEVTVDEIERCAGAQFDPDVSGVFLEKIEEFREEERADGKKVPE